MGFLKKHSHFLLALFVIFDLCILISVYIIAAFMTFGCTYVQQLTLRECISSSVVITILFFSLQKVEYAHKYRVRPFAEVIKNVLKFELLMLTVYYFFILFHIYPYTNDFVLRFVLITLVAFLTERLAVKTFLVIVRKSGFNYKNYLIVGAGTLSLRFYRTIMKSDDFGIKITGIFDDEYLQFQQLEKLPKEMRALLNGSTNDLEARLKEGNVDNVVIALPLSVEEKIIKLANICEKYGVRAELIPDYYRIVSKNPSVRVIKGYPLIGIRNVPLENIFNRLIKRMFDLVVASVMLVGCIPLFAVIMVMIKATSKGPVFFKQKRTGFRQREFKIYKFRTMHVNAAADTVQASEDDPRKTKFGDFLRRTNLDELPQLINIIKGEMSLIGPRPHMVQHTEEFYKKYDKYLVRHWVKPGLTGWAQVNGWRGDSDIGMRVKYDIEYIENWTFLLDIKILFLTIFGEKVKKNAY